MKPFKHIVIALSLVGGFPGRFAAAFSSRLVSSTRLYGAASIVTEQQQQDSMTTDKSSAPSTESLQETSATKQQQRQLQQRPGWDEDSKFSLDESVQFWKEFNVSPEDAPQKIRQIVSPYLLASNNPQARAYWLSQMLRSSYFSVNAVAGTLAHVFHDRFIDTSNNNNNNSGAAAQSPMAKLLDDGMVGSRLAFLLLEAFVSYQQDWKAIEQNLLQYPWDAALTTKKTATNNNIEVQWDHKQLNPLFVLSETNRLVREAIGVWGRRAKLNGKPSGVWLQAATAAAENHGRGDVSYYPDYYLNDFHYQTDGWLSSESAERYEVGTETLFLGRQDAMQRQTLLPLKKHFGDSASVASPPSILEVACGTGRFATFTRDNFPTSAMTLVDLSPFYLEKARENDEYWRNYRGKQALKDVSGAETMDLPETKFVQANAEKLPFPENSFDAVTTVYLFHELPHEARVRVAAELARVCKPNGMVVFSDSFQRGDRPPLDEQLVYFSKLNEPFYESYVAEDIPALFEQVGLQCSEKYMNSRTKTLSFIKPPAVK